MLQRNLNRFRQNLFQSLFVIIAALSACALSGCGIGGSGGPLTFGSNGGGPPPPTVVASFPATSGTLSGGVFPGTQNPCTQFVNGWAALGCQNSTVTGTVNLTSGGTYQIGVMAFGTNYQGWPQIQILVDGQPQGNPWTVNVGSVSTATNYVFPNISIVTPGNHNIGVEFINPLFDNSGTRSVFIQAVTIYK